MKRNLLIVLLTLALCCPLITAAADFPLVDEPTTLTFATWQRSGQVDYNDMLVWQKYEALTGVHIDWIHIPDSTFYERRNLMFATGDLPDAFYKARLTMNDITKYVAEGLLLPMNDLIDEQAPNLKAFFEDYPSVTKALTLDDGLLYSVGYFNLHPALTVGQRIFMNTEWMDNLGLEMPETIDDLTEILIAFRDNDANGNGDLTDEMPLSSGAIANVYLAFRGAYGLGNHGNAINYVDLNEDGAMRYYAMAEGYRQLMQQLQYWYAEGLMDNEIFTATTESQVALGTANRIGVYPNINLTNTGEHFTKYEGIPAALIGPNGDQLYSSCNGIIYAPGSFVLCKDNQDPALSMRWIDYFYGEAGAELLFMVEKGLLYETDENGRNAYTDFVNLNPDGLTLTQVISAHTSWSGGQNPAILLDNYFIGGEAMPIPLAAAQRMDPYLPEEIWEAFSYTELESERMAELQNDLTSYVEEMRAQFITGKASLDTDWAKYVSTLETMGVQEYLDIITAAYGRYLAK